MKSEIIINNLNKWREKQKVKNIRLDKISVSHQEHLRTNTIDFQGNINSLSKYKNQRVVPVVVRKTKNGYQLLFGLKQLIIAKLMNYNRIKAIVVGCSRETLCEFFRDEYIDGECYSLKNIKISEDFARTIPNPNKISKKRKQINGGTVPTITVNDEGLLLDGYITYLILKEKGVKNANVKISKGEKAKSYKLKDGITKDDLEGAGFEEGHWNNPVEEDCMSKNIKLINDIELDMFIKTDPIEFDDFKNILVLDSAFCQPYTPFYGENYKQYINDFSYLQEVIRRYNEAMNSLGIFEEVV